MDSPSRAPSPSPAEPQPIRRLHESLINRIAAGEIIHRPASALKELLENALDAGATTLKITVKDGGLKLLQIQDNGCGIRKADLALLATRFATSKLGTFADLGTLRTYGFRGEALASVSHVAQLSVVTKTRADACAWKAHYADGVLVPPKPGFSSDPKPCAGNDGTTITVENMFYATPTRLAALRSAAEEYARILDVVTRYAVHNPSVAFICKKAGSSGPDVATPQGGTVPQAIGMLYGHAIARELLRVDVAPSTPSGRPPQSRKRKRPDSGGTAEEGDGDDDVGDAHEDEPMVNTAGTGPPDGAEEEEVGTEGWTAEAHITSPNHQARKFVFLLFINHRLVESARLKRAIEAAYGGTLPKGASPFVYLSLNLPPHTVDVNVHPTKREVHFLDEDAITERIADAVQAALVTGRGAHSRAYQQTLLTSGITDDPSATGKGKTRAVDAEDAEDAAPSKEQKQKKILSQHKVRTSTHDRTLDSMLPAAPRAAPSQIPSRSQEQGDSAASQAGEGVLVSPTPVKPRDIHESECYLQSVVALRAEVEKGKHRQFTEILENHVFVGVVDLERCLTLLQHAKQLYLVNHSSLAEELFYQLGLRQFGNFGRLKLKPPPSARALVKLAVDAEEGVSQSRLTRPEIVDAITDGLVARRELLSEYFSMDITSDGHVQSLPLLLHRYTPNLDRLPLFLMRLGPQVDWTDEAACFRTFLRELAYFYLPGPLPAAPPSDTREDSEESDALARKKAEDDDRWMLEHALFPAIRRYLCAPKTLLERDVVQVASLPDLYRVFERC